jgi:mono/diheme cytochrome c family protein
MNFFKTLLIGSGALLLLPRCTSDKIATLKPVAIDTTVATSYSAQIAPIIANNTCLSCHGPTNSGTKLHDYPNVSAKANNGSLYGAVAWNGTAQNMPAGGPKISDAEIATIKKWVDEGALNN